MEDTKQEVKDNIEVIRILDEILNGSKEKAYIVALDIVVGKRSAEEDLKKYKDVSEEYMKKYYRTDEKRIAAEKRVEVAIKLLDNLIYYAQHRPNCYSAQGVHGPDKCICDLNKTIDDLNNFAPKT